MVKGAGVKIRMTTEPDRMTRAGNYVLGLMNDTDRDRAERDLEIDPDFRDAVVRIAERMHMFDLAPPEDASDGLWRAIAERITNMPQMRPAMSADTTSARPPAPFPAADSPRQAAAHRSRILVVSALIAMFALGYLAGLLSEGFWR
jgi:anti-sigma-K factor RskA